MNSITLPQARTLCVNVQSARTSPRPSLIVAGVSRKNNAIGRLACNLNSPSLALRSALPTRPNLGFAKNPSLSSKTRLQSSTTDLAATSPEDHGNGNYTNSLLAFAAICGLMFCAVLSCGGLSTTVWETAKTGFVSSFSIIFVSELGDKTFFIAALLAMRQGRTPVLVGGVSALALMTIISVGIGILFQKLPTVLANFPIEKFATALLVYFGVRTINESLKLPVSDGAESGELADAEEMVDEVKKKEGARPETLFGAIISAFSLIFVAEWGDRSMLATIALGAAQSPLGVAVGAICGHAVATLIAVMGGSILSKYISERTIGLFGGVLFLIFAPLTYFGIF